MILKAALVGGKAAYDAVFNENELGQSSNHQVSERVIEECFQYIDLYVRQNRISYCNQNTMNDLSDGVLMILSRNNIKGSKADVDVFVHTSLNQLGVSIT